MELNALPTGVGQTLDKVVNDKMKGLSDKIMSYQFDIEPYLLSDKEVMKKLLSKGNPQFSPGQLNLMVYGSEYVPKLGLTRNGTSVVGTIGDAITKGASASAGTIPGLGSSSSVQAAINFSDKASATAALRLAGLSSNVFGYGVEEATSQLAEYSSQGKRILQARGTGINEKLAVMSGEFILKFMNSAKRQVLRSYKFSSRKTDGTYEVLTVYVLDPGTLTGAELRGLGSTVVGAADNVDIKIEQERFADEFEAIARKQAEARFGGFSPYPLPESSPIRKFAKEKKKEIREAFAMFMSKQKEMINDFTSTLTIIASAIPAMAIIITTPPFNIPAALTLINLVMQSINKIVGIIVELIAILEKLQDLSTFLGDEAYKKVSKIITPVVDVLTKLIDPIGSLKKFIEKIIEQIKKLFNSDNCKKHRRRLNRDIRRKERDLKNERDKEEKEDIEDELKILRDRLKELDKNCKKTSIEQDTENISKLLQETNDLSTKIVDDMVETLVYDVQLPTGETLQGISQEALDDLRLKYTILIVD